MSRVVLLLVLIGIVPGCASTLATNGQPTMNAVHPQYEQNLKVDRDGEVVLKLRASAPGTDWGKVGSESAVVSLHVDGTYDADVVLFAGEKVWEYTTLVGPLTKGEHRLEIRFEPDKSRAGVKTVQVEGVEARVFSPDDPLYSVIAHAPILYGRPEQNYSDTPILEYFERARDGDNTVITYTLIFTNEDGGTAPPALMSRWGRLTDIEHLYRVWLNANGEIVRDEYQDPDHVDEPFRGQREGSHPLLHDVTAHNTFSDQGTSPLKFALVPDQELEPGHAREEMMDRNPWTYRIMAQEWAREKQTRPDGAGDPPVGDPRDYAYVEFNTEYRGSDAARCDAALSIQLQLRNDNALHTSDHGVPALRVASRDWRRSTVELPHGTMAKDIARLRFVAYAGRQKDCVVVLHHVGKLFMLDADYKPQDSVFKWDGEKVLDPNDPAKQEAVFEITR